MQVEMSSLLHYPNEIMKLILRSFNQAVGMRVFQVRANKIELQIPSKLVKDRRLFILLYQKLNQAMKAISKKYVYPNARRTFPIDTQMVSSDEKLSIIIFGIQYIPPQKFVRLLDMILWYLLTMVTGYRPKGTEIGKTITEQWKANLKELKLKFTKARKRYELLLHPTFCSYCGEKTRRQVILMVRIGAEFIDYAFPVCEKHREETF